MLLPKSEFQALLIYDAIVIPPKFNFCQGKTNNNKNLSFDAYTSSFTHYNNEPGVYSFYNDAKEWQQEQNVINQT